MARGLFDGGCRRRRIGSTLNLCNGGFYFGHVADYQPDQVLGLDVFLGDFVGFGWRYGQGFFGEGVVVIFGKIVLKDGAVGAGELLDGLKLPGRARVELDCSSFSSSAVMGLSVTIFLY